MIRVGVIGYGHWGPNLVRNFADVPGVTVAAICDHHADQFAIIRRSFPEASTTQDHRDLLRDPSIDAVAIATPISSHFELAMAALQAGKHVLVEKPIAETLEQAHRLVDEADRRQRVLAVDHTLVYAGGVRKMADLVAAGELGRILTVDATRVNLGMLRDVNVIADLGVHDFSVLDHVVRERPVAVSATGAAPFDGIPESVAYVTLFYDSGTIAHVNLSWIAPIRFRRIMVGGTAKMLVYDELEPDHPIRLLDKGISFRDDAADAGKPALKRVVYRNGDVHAPKVDGAGALRAMAGHFVDCIRHSRAPLTDGRMGARMVELIDAATRSMRGRGQPVTLQQPGRSG
jgi:predicted dehydrogenase